MKKTHLLHAGLSHVLATLGHTDLLCVSDAGLPCPRGVPRIDLALRPGVPPFLAVLDTILEELAVEGAYLAEELREVSPGMHGEILERLTGITPVYVPHEQFKELTARARAVVRSGEFTPYSNVLLVCGVPYGPGAVRK